MNRRTKGFLIALIAAGGVAAIFGGKGGGAFFAKMLLLLFVIWLVWRAFARLWQLFRPVRQVVMPVTDEALRSVGFGKLVDAGQRVNRKIDEAVGENSDPDRPR